MMSLDAPPAVRINRGYAILTGHPPVHEQIADQVRSSSGMTFGQRRPGGGPAMMDAESTTDRLLAYLRAMDAAEAVLTPRNILYERFGNNLVNTLRILERQKKLAFWYGTRHDGAFKAEMVIRLAGSERELRTADAPTHRHV